MKKKPSSRPWPCGAEMSKPSTNVFVSYSHADESLVAPVVKLLRINQSLVFQDTDSIQPGRKWRSEIAKALAESHLVVVFWCNHASRSVEVLQEWKSAIDQEKDLLPLILDATPLPPELSEFQWIDFRDTVGANHSSIGSSAANVADKTLLPRPRAMSATKSVRWLSLAGFATVFVTVLALGLFTTHAPQFPSEMAAPEPPGSVSSTPVPVTPSHPAAKPKPTPPVPTSNTSDFLPGNNIALALGIVLAVTAFLVWVRAKRRKPIEQCAHAHPGEIERQIANQIEAEIMRRKTLKQEDGT